MRVVIVGNVCIDHSVSEGVNYDGPGSPPVFIQKVYSQFPDIQTTIISSYGEDFLPYTKNLKILPQKPTSSKTLIYENTSQGNVRTQKEFNREEAKEVEITSEIISALGEADIFFLAPITPNFSVSYVKEILKYKNDKALSILLPQGYYRNLKDNQVVFRDFVEAEELIPLFDFVVVSNQDGQNILEEAKKWSEKTQVIMTLGDAGAALIKNGNMTKVPTESVKVEEIVDSVGSGDIFSASFAYQYFLTKNPLESIKFANKIARDCLFQPNDNLQIHL